jgi:ribonuclease Z
MVKLTFLGTANAFGHGGRRRSHYLVEGETKALIDVGYDTLSGLRSVGLTVADIDYIFISHLHPDHYLGLPQMALENFFVIKKENPIYVYCPPGTRELVLSTTGLLFDELIQTHIDTLFKFVEFDANEVVSFPRGEIKTFEAQHSGNARMQLITFEGKKIGYTGDTAYLPEVFSMLLEADITITEASSASHPIPDHTTLDELIEANFPKDKRIFISHVGESVIKHKHRIKEPLILAEDGMIIEI